jgi:probable HAF family extracellular repeat protein
MREIAVPGAASRAYNVNSAGVVVGSSFSDGGDLRAFAWDRGRAVLLPELGAPPLRMPSTTRGRSSA